MGFFWVRLGAGVRGVRRLRVLDSMVSERRAGGEASGSLVVVLVREAGWTVVLARLVRLQLHRGSTESDSLVLLALGIATTHLSSSVVDSYHRVIDTRRRQICPTKLYQI